MIEKAAVHLHVRVARGLSDYAATAPQVRERAPQVQQWFQQLFEEGLDTPMEQAVELVVALALGRADAMYRSPVWFRRRTSSW